MTMCCSKCRVCRSSSLEDSGSRLGSGICSGRMPHNRSETALRLALAQASQPCWGPSSASQLACRWLRRVGRVRGWGRSAPAQPRHSLLRLLDKRRGKLLMPLLAKFRVFSNQYRCRRLDEPQRECRFYSLAFGNVGKKLEAETTCGASCQDYFVRSLDKTGTAQC